jgi:hypothetical protein
MFCQEEPEKDPESKTKILDILCVPVRPPVCPAAGRDRRLSWARVRDVCACHRYATEDDFEQPAAEEAPVEEAEAAAEDAAPAEETF